jgi:hypothetical protein
MSGGNIAKKIKKMFGRPVLLPIFNIFRPDTASLDCALLSSLHTALYRRD